MKKIFLLSLLALLLGIGNPTSKAQNKIPLENLIPNDEYFIFELNLENEKQSAPILKLIERFEKKAKNEIPKIKRPVLENFLNILKEPNRFLMTIKINDENTRLIDDLAEFDFSSILYRGYYYDTNNYFEKMLQLIKNLGIEYTKNSYNSKDYYEITFPEKFQNLIPIEKEYIAVIDGIIIETNSLESLKKSIDLKPENSLRNNPKYQKTTSAINHEYLAGIFINWEAIMNNIISWVEQENPEDAKQLRMQKYDYYFGAVLGIDPIGYRFTANAVSSKEVFDELGYTYSDILNFTPRLYKEFPSKSPIFYQEQFNYKALVTGMLNMFNKTIVLKQESRTNSDETDEGEKSKEEPFSIEQTFEEYTGLNLQNDILSWMDKEIAFGLQFDSDESLLPALTLMINANTDPQVAQKTLDNLTTSIEQGLITLSALMEGKNYVSLNEITEGNSTFKQISVDLPAILKDPYLTSGNPIPENIQNYIKPLSIIYGINDKNLVFLSTYSDIAKHFGEGLQSNQDFKSLYETLNSSKGPFAYMSLQNLFTQVLTASEKNEISKNIYSRENIKNLVIFKEILSILSYIKDFASISEEMDPYSMSNRTLIRKQNPEDSRNQIHSFEEDQQNFEESKTKDSDKDGRTDYEEEFIYGTNKSKRDYVSAIQFTDVTSNDWFSTYVHALANNNIIGGYADTKGKKSFKPFQNITRAEFVKLVVDVFGIKKAYYIGEEPFSDVKSRDDWFYPYVLGAYNAGLIKGYEDSTFRPHAPINRAEALKIALSAYRESFEDKQTADSSFADTEGHWAKTYAEFAATKGIIKGFDLQKALDSKPKLYFAPDRLITRAEAVKIIAEIRKLQYTEIYTENPLEKFEDEIFDEIINLITN